MVKHKVVDAPRMSKGATKGMTEIVERYEEMGYEYRDSVAIKGTTKSLVFVKYDD